MAEEINKKLYHVQDNSDIEVNVLSAARSYYAQGNYSEALKLLLDTTNKTVNAEILIDIGNCYYMLNGQKEALEYWNKAIELDPKNAKAYTNLGNLHYKNNQIEMAISYWLVALITKPEDSKTSLNLAVAFDKKDMRFESIKYFEKYIKYEKEKHSEEYMRIKSNLQHCFDVASQYLEHGVKYQSEGDNKTAAACYFKSLANYPNLSKTNLNLGSIFFEDKNLELAIKYWKMAGYIDPNYDKIYSNLAISYDLMKEFDYAYCYYYQYMNFNISNKEEYYKTNKRLLKIKPYLNNHKDLIEKHLTNAKKHLANNEIYEAIDEFKNYSILKPEDAKTYKELIKKLESYLNPELDIIANCFEIGNNLIKEKNYSEAKPYFWRIMKLSSPQYLEYSKAKAKYAQCEKGQVGMLDV